MLECQKNRQNDFENKKFIGKFDRYGNIVVEYVKRSLCLEKKVQIVDRKVILKALTSVPLSLILVCRSV